MNTASLTAKPRKKLDRATVIAIGVIFAIYALAFVLEQVIPSTSMLFTVLKKGATYALVAVSMNLLNGFTGLFSLGQAGFMLIGAYTYAVFTCRGKMPDAFRETYKRICTEFFPQSNYEYGQGVELEVYPSADTQNPDYTCEIWIAVKEKT